MQFKNEVSEIISRDNVVNLHRTEKENWKTVVKSQFDKNTEIILEEKFDAWFLSQWEEQQKEYLIDINKLEDEFNLECCSLSIWTDIDLYNMHSMLFEQLLIENQEKIREVDNLIDNIAMYENTEKYSEQLKNLQVLKAELNDRNNWSWQQRFNNPYINRSYPLWYKEKQNIKPKEQLFLNHFISDDSLKEWVYKIETSKKISDYEYEISFRPYTDSPVITKIVSSGDLVKFKYWLVLFSDWGLASEEINEISSKERNFLTNRSLSHSEFLTYFNPSERLVQSENIWDCYLIAWMNWMRQLRHRETIISNHIKINYDSKWDIKTIGVSIPLWWFPIRENIEVEASCLNNPNLLKGSLWYKAIEIAYLKLRANRQWLSDHTWFFSPQLNTDILTWWLMSEVWKDFFGGWVNWWVDITNWTIRKSDGFENYFKNMWFATSLVSPYNCIATVSSREWWANIITDLHWKKHKLHKNHAFTLIDVISKNTRWESYAILENPWNPDNIIHIRLSDFAQFFDNIQIITFDYQKMFDR